MKNPTKASKLTNMSNKKNTKIQKNFIIHNKCIKLKFVLLKKVFIHKKNNVKKTYKHKNLHLEDILCTL